MSLVAVEDRGQVRHIVMSRPEKRNALNRELLERLAEALEEAAEDGSVRVVVLSGEGPMFSAGMDVGDLAQLSDSPDNLREYRNPLVEMYNQLEEMLKPTIAKIHGAAIGGAMELSLACDLRTMAEDAVAGLVETRVGLIPDVGGCSRLPSVVGLGRAKELIMTGRFIDGREAHAIGFANRISPADKLADVTGQLCDELLAAAPKAVALAKSVLDSVAKPHL